MNRRVVELAGAPVESEKSQIIDSGLVVLNPRRIFQASTLHAEILRPFCFASGDACDADWFRRSDSRRR